MASKALKGLTIKIGADTSDLFESLQGIEKKGKSLSGELTQINKLLKLDPRNTELLAQKQKVLADAISNTETKLDTLKEAEKQAQEQFARGEISEEQYRALQREIVATQKKLDGYREEAKAAAEASKKLGKEAKNAATGVGMTEQEAKEAKEALEDLESSAADLAVGGLTAVAAAATAAVTAVVALAEESREYRTEMAKLDTAFQAANFTGEAATATYEALQSVLGETGQAVEASNMLAKLCTTEEELSQWTEILTGVYGTFGTSLPVEALAESANETARVGQIAGNLADAISWATATGETFGVTLKKNTKANEEWNEKVKAATTAEDFFNLALEECSNEQERQQLITKTLTKLYGSAAAQYKETNAEVIRANQNTEKWNKVTAKVGKTVEPVVNDIKELGIALAEDAADPLQDIAKFVQKDVIPAIKSVGNWVKKNLPAIKVGVVGLTAALVTHKVAVLAAELASKGWTVATLAQAAAQKVLDAVMAASPWGLVATAIVGVTAALVTLAITTKDARQPVDVLTDEEKALAEAADEAAEAFREQRKATEEALKDISAQMGYVGDLAAELQTLADATGRVQEKDEARAQFILNELNEALGTEYTMVDGIIQKYDQLTTSIEEVIKAKTANALIEAYNDQYVEALTSVGTAYENMLLKEKEYQAQLEVAQQYQREASDAWARYYNALNEANFVAAAGYQYLAQQADESYQTERGFLNEKKAAYDEAAGIYNSHRYTIETYTAAESQALQGNYETAVDLLARKGGEYNAFAGVVDEETAKVLATLQQEAIDAGIHAEYTRTQFQKGVDGFSQPMVDEAEENYEKAMDEFENAYADAYSVGEDLSDGLANGSESKRLTLEQKARSLVTGFLRAARAAADSHSPSRKTMALGEDLGEGAEIGIENKTKDIKKAATQQMAGVLDAYSAQEVTAQRTLRTVAEQQSAQQFGTQQMAASANSPMLEKILAAIEKGQIITLDGDALVGATANKMDNALGRRRALASRGAI